MTNNKLPRRHELSRPLFLFVPVENFEIE